MANYGRIQAVVIATLTGNVVYERFYDSFSDLEKSDLRSALQQVNQPLTAAYPCRVVISGSHGTCCTSERRRAPGVWPPRACATAMPAGGW